MDNYFVQVYVPLAKYQSKSYDYRRELAAIEVVNNVRISLYMVTIKPGVIVLLEALYEPAAHKTTVLSLHSTGENQTLRKRCRTNTTVCEVLEAWIQRPGGKFPYIATWYRLGNGMIVGYSGLKLRCGDMLVIDYIENENGEWDELLDITKSPVSQWL